MFARRLEAVEQRIIESRLGGLFVTSLPNIRYLTGFTGSNAILLVRPKGSEFFTDSRYKIQAAEEVTHVPVTVAAGKLFEAASRSIAGGKKGKIGFEANSLHVSELRKLEGFFGKAAPVPTTGIVEELRVRKEGTEIFSINRAAEITDRVFNKILGILKPGVRELEVAAEISYWHKVFGAESDSFESLVASGVRGSLPHGRPSDKKIQKGEMVTIDMGCRVDGYHCDVSRTVSAGRPNTELKTIYRIVLDAQERSLERILPGIPARTVDGIARAHIRRKGYGKFFGHSLGHGLGLELHELPRVSMKSNDILEEGSVITVEPGIYIPQLGGVRIEDDVVVRHHGCEIISKSPKELLIL
ncbi:MAG TPA: Xaa-Pro peptidase family protein [Bacteroidota bacterium]